MRILGVTASSYESYTAFESIATATGTGSSGTITFSNIPGTYQHLQIRGIMSSTTAQSTRLDLIIRTNGSAGTNYSWHSIRGNGASAAIYANFDASEGKAPFSIPTANYTSQVGAIILDIHDYASTTKYKTMRQFSGSDNNGAGAVNIGSALWMSTSAITSIDLIVDSYNFSTSTTFALYGVKGA
jgi:hypothetical protein